MAHGRLRFRDTRRAVVEVAAEVLQQPAREPRGRCVLPHPRRHQGDNPVLLEVRPRLGNDYVDGRGLPANFEMAVLADAGRDTLFGGRGNDYLGGAMDNDRTHGGAGRDWIRGGDCRDRLWGGDAQRLDHRAERPRRDRRGQRQGPHLPVTGLLTR